METIEDRPLLSFVVRARVVPELGLRRLLLHSSVQRWTHPSASLSHGGGESTLQRAALLLYFITHSSLFLSFSVRLPPLRH